MTTTPTMIKTNSVLQTQKTFCLALVPRRPFNAAALCKKGRRNSFIKGVDTNTTTKRAVHTNVVALSRFDDVNNNNDDDDDGGRGRRVFLALAVASTATSGWTCGGLNNNNDPKQKEARAMMQSEIELRDVRYAATECPPNQYIPSKKSAMCVEFTATATSKKNVSAANVFGFVDDYDGNSAATNNDTGTSRVVLSQIDRPIPEGTSEVKFVVTVFKDSYKKGAFKLRGFKAIEANAAINKRFVPLGDCDLDPAAPGCPNDPNA